jgi:hypothetical protein
MVSQMNYQIAFNKSLVAQEESASLTYGVIFLFDVYCFVIIIENVTKN